MTGNNSQCEEEEEVVLKDRGRDRGWANPLLHAPAIIAILKGTMTKYLFGNIVVFFKKISILK
jgi:hypothetical protein